MTHLLRLAVPAAILLVACDTPHTTVSIPTEGPRLIIAKAPAGALLLVDGKSMGEAQRYNGDPGVLRLEPGTHLVEVKLGDKLLLSTKVFFGGSEIRTLEI